MSGPEYDFLEMMIDTITLEPQTAIDGYSKPTYGQAVEKRARVEYRTRLVRTVEGVEAVSTATTILFDVLAVDPTSRITLPDGSQPKILAVNNYKDTSGIYNVEIMT